MKGTIIALVGPSGVGKNYLKSSIKKKFPGVVELTVFTTRPSRESDGVDRKAGLDLEYFMSRVESGEIIAAHQPFAELDYWYGFSKEQIDDLLDKDDIILTEIHIDNVDFFRKEYGDKVFMIGITAALDYLDKNIQERGSEQALERSIRLDKAESENSAVRDFYANHAVDKVFEANWENRDTLASSVIAEIEVVFKKPIFEEMKKFK
jgi:guanylate kinase